MVEETRSHHNSSRQERETVTYSYSRPISRKRTKKFSGLPQAHAGRQLVRNKVKSIHITYISVTCKVARVLTVENMYSSDFIIKFLYLTDREWKYASTQWGGVSQNLFQKLWFHQFVSQVLDILFQQWRQKPSLTSNQTIEERGNLLIKSLTCLLLKWFILPATNHHQASRSQVYKEVNISNDHSSFQFDL